MLFRYFLVLLVISSPRLISASTRTARMIALAANRIRLMSVLINYTFRTYTRAIELSMDVSHATKILIRACSADTDTRASNNENKAFQLTRQTVISFYETTSRSIRETQHARCARGSPFLAFRTFSPRSERKIESVEIRISLIDESFVPAYARIKFGVIVARNKTRIRDVSSRYIPDEEATREECTAVNYSPRFMSAMRTFSLYYG